MKPPSSQPSPSESQSVEPELAASSIILPPELSCPRVVNEIIRLAQMYDNLKTSGVSENEASDILVKNVNPEVENAIKKCLGEQSEGSNEEIQNNMEQMGNNIDSSKNHMEEMEINMDSSENNMGEMGINMDSRGKMMDQTGISVHEIGNNTGQMGSNLTQMEDNMKNIVQSSHDVQVSHSASNENQKPRVEKPELVSGCQGSLNQRNPESVSNEDSKFGMESKAVKFSCACSQSEQGLSSKAEDYPNPQAENVDTKGCLAGFKNEKNAALDSDRRTKIEADKPLTYSQAPQLDKNQEQVTYEEETRCMDQSPSVVQFQKFLQALISSSSELNDSKDEQSQPKTESHCENILQDQQPKSSNEICLNHNPGSLTSLEVAKVLESNNRCDDSERAPDRAPEAHGDTMFVSATEFKDDKKSPVSDVDMKKAHSISKENREKPVEKDLDEPSPSVQTTVDSKSELLDNAITKKLLVHGGNQADKLVDFESSVENVVKLTDSYKEEQNALEKEKCSSSDIWKMEKACSSMPSSTNQGDSKALDAHQISQQVPTVALVTHNATTELSAPQNDEKQAVTATSSSDEPQSLDSNGSRPEDGTNVFDEEMREKAWFSQLYEHYRGMRIINNYVQMDQKYYEEKESAMLKLQMEMYSKEIKARKEAEERQKAEMNEKNSNEAAKDINGKKNANEVAKKSDGKKDANEAAKDIDGNKNVNEAAKESDGKKNVKFAKPEVSGVCREQGQVENEENQTPKKDQEEPSKSTWVKRNIFLRKETKFKTNSITSASSFYKRQYHPQLTVNN